MLGPDDNFVVTRPAVPGVSPERHYLFVHRFPYRTRMTVMWILFACFLIAQSAVVFATLRMFQLHDDGLLFPIIALDLGIVIVTLLTAYEIQSPLYYGPLPPGYDAGTSEIVSDH